MKKLLILGGKPIATYDIISYAKEIGIYVIVTDNVLIENSPAKQIADEAWDVSTAETTQLQKLIETNGVDAVFTGVHEFNIGKTLELANECSLPFYATNEQMEITSVKSKYKRLFQEFDIPVVPEYDLDKLLHVEYPVLVKPVDGSGGYGITICNNHKEVSKAVDYAKTFSKKNEVLIEKYLRQKEVSIFYIIQNGEIFLSAMADRNTYLFEKGVIPLPTSYDFPSIHLSEFVANQNEKTISALKSIGLKNGMLFIQAFVDEGKFIYYDIGFRLTGTQEYHILEELCGYNPLKMLVDFSLTGKMGKKDIRKLVDPHLNGKFACNITFLSKPGKIKQFIGIEEINNHPGVLKTVINHNIGETIPETAIGTLNQVVFRVFAVANSKVEYDDLKQFITNTFDVISDDNQSILIN